ncbi:4-carboxymuconolactone decarboxylase [Variovorax sp. SRS16]|uniref:carboxymuconolactone decarboxylase family protein n=1 Tax=Variovorax sp. SRS16 TaxID=282217 RepID=UPI0013186CC3|nr:carboxymuconolactone decarboxylase family protein [Variovorax sp. SRS16]VTU13181.1 4-carboxymuconolactone decarboxylase [Variovorax sp. SRS16]
MTDMTISQRRAAGAKVRREVLGVAHVQPDAQPSIFDSTFTAFTEDFCWGNVWTRPGLERSTRSMINIAMLAAMGCWHEFEVHVRGALNNGVTEAEIAEIVLQAGVYAGIPIAAEGLRRAKAVVMQARGSPEGTQVP